MPLKEDQTAKKIFKDVYGSSVHIGNNNSCVAVIADSEHGQGKKDVMKCYDRHLSITHELNIDYDRPLTIVRCHPTDKVVACGDTTGRILIVAGFGSQEEILKY